MGDNFISCSKFVGELILPLACNMEVLFVLWEGLLGCYVEELKMMWTRDFADGGITENTVITQPQYTLTHLLLQVRNSTQASIQ